MPRGVYKRTAAMREAIRQARLIAPPMSEETRVKLRKITRRNAVDPAWLKKVSECTKKAMHRDDVRKKHLRGLRRARKNHGINFKGGNGQEPVAFVKLLADSLIPIGFVQEHIVAIPHYRGRYALDFALVEGKIDIEVDGPSRRPVKKQERDAVRDKFLKSLGWKVIRVKHD